MSTSDDFLIFEVIKGLDLSQDQIAPLVDMVNDSAERHVATGDTAGAVELFGRVHRLRDMQLHARLGREGDRRITHSEIRETSAQRSKSRAQLRAELLGSAKRFGIKGLPSQ